MRPPKKEWPENQPDLPTLLCVVLLVAFFVTLIIAGIEILG